MIRLLNILIICTFIFITPNYVKAQEQGNEPPPPVIIRRSEKVIRGLAETKAVPEYPQKAIDEKITGDVVVELTIDEKGKVANARLVSGPKELQQAALVAAKKWEFKATTIDGVAVKVSGVITFRFKLDEDADDNSVANNGDSYTIRRSEAVIRGKATHIVAPEYPDQARRNNIQGDVVIEILIGEDGKIEEANVISGHASLQQVALDAAKKWTFEATKINNVPVKVKGILTFRFVI